MRFVYNVTLASKKSATVPSQERIWDCLRFFRERFGEEAVVSVTERFGNSEPVQSYLLPLSREEAKALEMKNRIFRAIGKFQEKNARQSVSRNTLRR